MTDDNWQQEAERLKEKYDKETHDFWAGADKRLDDWNDAKESDSAFDSKNFQPVVLIQLMRLYDVQLAMLSMLNEEKAEILRAMHERGQTFCPPPAFVEYEEDSS